MRGRIGFRACWNTRYDVDKQRQVYCRKPKGHSGDCVFS